VSKVGAQNVCVAISGCRLLSQSSVTVSSSSAQSKTQICRWNFEFEYFQIWQPHCRFRLSAVVAVTGWHLYRARYVGLQSRICRWNFNAVSHSFADISTSGFDGHSAISGSPSISHLFCGHFNSFSLSRSKTLLLPLELQEYLHYFVGVQLHELTWAWNFDSFKIIVWVWRHAKQLPMHRLTSWLLLCVPHSCSRKVKTQHRTEFY